MPYEDVSKSFRTGRLELELQMVHLCAITCSYIAILWVSLVIFAAIALYVASQRAFIVVVYFVIDSVRKLLDTPCYVTRNESIKENCSYDFQMPKFLSFWTIQVFHRCR
jgi:hypothetical protein